jgi:2-succinyl-6-hydroxy-2,4-cyclohexadiene-1-carboxylate synthase
VTTDDQPLAIERSGAGRRVVLVHGFTQTGASWRRVADRLADRFEVVRVDLPGHGRSEGIRVADLSGAAARLAATTGRASYVGYSLGGRVGLTLALERPDLVEQLVLVGATAGIEDAEERRARRRADEALADRLDPPDDTPPLGLEAFLAEWLAGPLFADLDPEAADVAARSANTPTGLASSLRTVGTGTQEPTWGRLGALTMPVTVGTGARDEKFTRLGERLVAAIGPRATAHVVAGTGHAVPFEAPGTFAELVARELTTRSRG